MAQALWNALMGTARQRRTSPENVLGHPTRSRILDLIRRGPGTTMGSLSQGLGIPRGTAAYHLRLLERIGVLDSHWTGHTRHFYAAGASVEDRKGIAALHRQRALEIVHTVRARPGIGQRELLALIGMKRKVFRSYARSLVEAGLLDERRQGRYRVYASTERLERLLAGTSLVPPRPPALAPGPGRPPGEG